jgi:hypothetical protein
MYFQIHGISLKRDGFMVISNFQIVMIETVAAMLPILSESRNHFDVILITLDYPPVCTTSAISYENKI